MPSDSLARLLPSMAREREALECSFQPTSAEVLHRGSGGRTPFRVSFEGMKALPKAPNKILQSTNAVGPARTSPEGLRPSGTAGEPDPRGSFRFISGAVS